MEKVREFPRSSIVSLEVWKDIKGYEGIYQVSNMGKIRSLTRVVIDKNGIQKNIKGKTLKLSTTTQGYKAVVFKKDGKNKNFRVHRLVAQAFIKNYESKPYVNHIDGNKKNNKASNLEWCTNSENMKHAFAIGLKVPSNPNKNGKRQGSLHSLSKLSDIEVMEIRRKYKDGASLSLLSEDFHVTKENVSSIVRGDTWKHLPTKERRDNFTRNSSGYKYVESLKTGYRGRFYHKGKMINCGMFKTAKEAFDSVTKNKEKLGVN